MIKPSYFDVDKATDEKLVTYYHDFINDEFCACCRYSSQCNGLTLTAGGPGYPPCADNLAKCINIDSVIEQIKEFFEEEDIKEE